jgi:NAD(P)-dependent dehydrogenase (short-subunit alcohol dehydrogenase family)
MVVTAAESVKTSPQPKVALVTGAAQGIGLATARRLSAAGFCVFGTSRSPVYDSHAETEMLELEVADEASVRRCVRTVLGRTGRIDVVVNNVGGGIAGAVEETSLTEAQRVFEVNLWGAVRVAQAVLPTMRNQGTGRIIALSFAPTLVGLPFRSAYCASKFALESMFEALSCELARTGIHVSVIKPGAVATAAADRVPRAATRLDDYTEPRERVTALFDRAMRTGMDPDRVAHTIVKAATASKPRAQYVVGVAGRSLYTAQRAMPRAAIRAALIWLARSHTKGPHTWARSTSSQPD